MTDAAPPRSASVWSDPINTQIAQGFPDAGGLRRW